MASLPRKRGELHAPPAYAGGSLKRQSFIKLVPLSMYRC